MKGPSTSTVASTTAASTAGSVSTSNNAVAPPAEHGAGPTIRVEPESEESDPDDPGHSGILNVPFLTV